MKILIAGICGFVGSTLAGALAEHLESVTLFGIDNLMRPGSEINRASLRQRGITVVHGDIRNASDLQALPAVDWVIDAAASTSVLAGLGSGSSSRQLFEHNLSGMLNVLEYCKCHRSGLLFLSTSRVYSVPGLCSLPLRSGECGFSLDGQAALPPGVSAAGIGPAFSVIPPVSLYGSSKLASEYIALEYGQTFDFPVWITRCGVLAGAGQFGTADQGLFSFWINAHRHRRPLRFIGFDGTGPQVRDVFHPSDLTGLLVRQMRTGRHAGTRVYTAGGGTANSISLGALNRWCNQRFGPHQPLPDLRPRPFDVPWIVMDSGALATDFGWRVTTPLAAILEEIAVHSEAHPDWLEWSGT